MTDSIRVEQTARAEFAAARNCSESVIFALQRELDLPGVPVSIGSGFTSGIAKTGCVCGALAAAVMMLGAYAESEQLEPEARRLRAEQLSGEFIEAFKERWGATCCRTIRRGQDHGSAETLRSCAGLSEHAAGLALEIVERARGSAPRRHGPRDAMAVAQRLATASLAAAAVGLLATLVAALVTQAPAWPVVAAALAGLAVALLGEFGGARPRRLLRVLGAAGLASAALSGVLALAGGTAVREALALVVGSPAVVAVAVVALAALAAVRVFEVARYR